MKHELNGYFKLEEPKLLFCDNKEHISPLFGLSEYGPYSKRQVSDINCKIVTTEDSAGKLLTLLGEMKSFSDKITFSKEYYLAYKGFSEIYGIDLNYDENNIIKISSSLTSSDLEKYFSRIFQGLKKEHYSFNILIIYLPRNLEIYYSKIKMLSAENRVSVQIITEKAFSGTERASILWGLSIAIYAKSFGIPWKLKSMNKEDAFLGLSYTTKENEGKKDYVTCCSQIYEPDGTGFEFVAYNTKDYSLDSAKNPHLSYSEMSDLLSKSIHIYQNSHTGSLPKRLFIHKNTVFLPDEINAAYDTLAHKTKVELLQIVESTIWKGVRIDIAKQHSFYPCKRGSYLVLSNNECLLWTQGAVELNALPNYYKEAYSIPKAIKIIRHLGNASWDEICSSILALTKMDWNKSQLYKKLPVTLEYSKKFAQIIQDSNKVKCNEVFNYTYFM